MAKILLVRTDGIGDVLLSVPLAGTIKRERPGDKIWLLTRHYTREIGENHPAIDGVLTTDDENGEPYPFMAMARMLRSHGFDSAVLLYARFGIALLLRTAGIPTRIGTGYRWFSFLLTKKVYEHRKSIRKHELEYNLSLLKPLGIDTECGELVFLVPDSAVRRADGILEEYAIRHGEPFVVLHPGSGGSALEWPPGKFARLADELIRTCRLRVVITGGPKESRLLERIAGSITEPADIVDRRLTLSELGALLKRASLVISNSTGPLHLAVAVGTEVIGLYPPITLCSPLRWGPYGRKDSVIVPACREFRTRKEALNELPGCMDMIPVQTVLELALRKLNRTIGAGQEKG